MDKPTGSRIEERAKQIFLDVQQAQWRRTDKMFAILMAVQFVVGLVLAVVVSPKAWSGSSSSIHVHVYVALILGGLLSALPIVLALRFGGATYTRHTIAVAQMLTSALWIHLSGGRIETHFHIFGSLAFLAFYRDWRIFITATIVVAGDHLIRGMYYPESIYGVLTASPWRVFEHAAWVIFENIFLTISCFRSMNEMRRITHEQAELEFKNVQISSLVTELEGKERALEEINRNLESLVAERTKQLHETLTNVSSLLNNMKQAVFSIDAQARVIPPVSKFAEAVFGTVIEGCSVYETVFKDLDPKTQRASGLRAALSVVFGEGELQWDMIEGNLVRTVPYGEKTLKISYSPLWSGAGTLDRVMMVVEDITEVLALEEKVRVDNEQIRMLQQLASNQLSELPTFFGSCNSLLQSIEQLLAKDSLDAEDFRVIMRNLHTVKGNARAMSLESVSGVTHQVEGDLGTTMSDYLDGRRPRQKIVDEIRGGVTRVRDQLRLYSRVASRVFKIQDDIESKLVASAHDTVVAVEEMISDIESLKPGDLNQALLHLQTVARNLSASDLEESAAKALRIVQASRPAGEILPAVRNVAQHMHAFYRGSTSFATRADLSETWIEALQEVCRLHALNQDNASRASNATVESVRFLQQSDLQGLLCFRQILAPVQRTVLAGRPISQQELGPAVAAMLRYATILLRVDCESTLSGDQRSALKKLLDSLPKDNRGALVALEEFDKRSCLLVSFLRRLVRGNNLHPSVVLATLSGGAGAARVLEFLLGDRTVRTSLLLEKLVESRFDFEEVELDAADRPQLTELQALLCQGPSLLSALGYSSAVDLEHVLAYYAEDRTSAGVTIDYQSLEVLEAHIRNVQKIIKEISPRLANTHGRELLQAVGKLKHSPVKPMLHKLNAMVEDISKRLGKSVDLKVRGDNVTLERDQLGLLSDAMTHLVRNALDHGIEEMADRTRARKAERGTLIIECSDLKDGITITVTDDGRGIDADAVAREAVAKKFLATSRIETMCRTDKLNLVFLPNFSTREQANEFSGRGVGLDVVRTNLSRLNGTVAVDSDGTGTRFTLFIPHQGGSRQDLERDRAA